MWLIPVFHLDWNPIPRYVLMIAKIYFVNLCVSGKHGLKWCYSRCSRWSAWSHYFGMYSCIYFFVKLQNVIVVPMLDDIFKQPLLPSSRVTSCLLFLRVLLRDALINKEGSWKWFSCKTHSFAFTFLLFYVCYLGDLVFIPMHDFKVCHCWFKSICTIFWRMSCDYCRRKNTSGVNSFPWGCLWATGVLSCIGFSCFGSIFRSAWRKGIMYQILILESTYSLFSETMRLTVLYESPDFVKILVSHYICGYICPFWYSYVLYYKLWSFMLIMQPTEDELRIWCFTYEVGFPCLILDRTILGKILVPHQSHNVRDWRVWNLFHNIRDPKDKIKFLQLIWLVKR
jgi:hypothetical protein